MNGRYNMPVATPLTPDTSLDVEARQVEAWRAMRPTQKADLICALTRTAGELALAGVRHRFPDAPPRELFLRLAIVTLGLELARSAYPDIDRLGLT